MTMRDALEAAASRPEPQLSWTYRQGVVRGAHNTLCGPEQERAYGTLRLLALATLRLPDLVLYAHFAHVCDDELVNDEDGDARAGALLVLTAVSDVATGALRLGHRALETHGRDVGYDSRAWVRCAVQRAGVELQACASSVAGVPITIEQTRRATVALTRAIAASVDDPLRFSDQLSHGLGHLLAVYLITREAGGG